MAALDKWKVLPKTAYSSTPWQWVVLLILMEFATALALGLLMEFFGIDGSAAGLAFTLLIVSSFALYAEKRQPNVLTPKIRQQLSLRVAALLAVLATPLLLIPSEEKVTLGWGGLLFVTAFVFVFSYIAHLFGLWLGVRNAKRMRGATGPH